jgi:hypothetical protein
MKNQKLKTHIKNVKISLCLICIFNISFLIFNIEQIQFRSATLSDI